MMLIQVISSPTLKQKTEITRSYSEKPIQSKKSKHWATHSRALAYQPRHPFKFKILTIEKTCWDRNKRAENLITQKFEHTKWSKASSRNWKHILTSKLNIISIKHSIIYILRPTHCSYHFSAIKIRLGCGHSWHTNIGTSYHKYTDSKISKSVDLLHSKWLNTMKPTPPSHHLLWHKKSTIAGRIMRLQTAHPFSSVLKFHHIPEVTSHSAWLECKAPDRWDKHIAPAANFHTKQNQVYLHIQNVNHKL